MMEEFEINETDHLLEQAIFLVHMVLNLATLELKAKLLSINN